MGGLLLDVDEYTTETTSMLIIMANDMALEGVISLGNVLPHIPIHYHSNMWFCSQVVQGYNGERM
jgi:hypothetical protein